MKSAKLFPGGVVNLDHSVMTIHERYDKLIVSKPDTKIIELHRSNYTAFINNDSFEFKREAIANCIRLYGNFYVWLKYQLFYNRFLHGTNQDFLLDTLWYIKTGERKMMLPVWESIITQYPDIGPVKPVRHSDITIANFIDSDSNLVNPYSNYITEWTSHPDGLNDMLYTTYLLFGSADVGTLNKMNINN